MKECYRLLARGKRMLSRHNPEEALKLFRQALELCPSEDAEGVTRILFYTGISLQKLGYSGCAVRSWSAAVRLRKGGACRRMVERLTNAYGMPRREDEDFQAFSSIQQTRYLGSRRLGKFGSDAEKDVVLDMIRSAWEELRRQNDLSGLSVEEKIRLFNRELIIFPYLECPDQWEDNTICVDFRREKRVEAADPCPCGSGRAYGSCCGRILSPDELEFGLF